MRLLPPKPKPPPDTALICGSDTALALAMHNETPALPEALSTEHEGTLGAQRCSEIENLATRLRTWPTPP